MKHDIQLRLVSIAFRGSLNLCPLSLWEPCFSAEEDLNLTRLEYLKYLKVRVCENDLNNTCFIVGECFTTHVLQN